MRETIRVCAQSPNPEVLAKAKLLRCIEKRGAHHRHRDARQNDA